MYKPVIKSDLSFDEYFMRMVYLVASKSKDPSSKIGSVLIKDNNIISTGFNGFPSKVADLEERYLNKELKYQMISHSESNSILFAARNGLSTLGCKLFTNGYCCSNCAITLIQSGVIELIYHKQFVGMNEKWHKSSSISNIMFREAGVKIRVFDKKLGLTARCNGSNIEV